MIIFHFSSALTARAHKHGWPKFTELFVGYLQSFLRKKDCVLLLVARLTNRRIVVALSIIILIIPFHKSQGLVSKPQGYSFVIIKFISWHWGRFNDIIKVWKVPKHGSYLTNHWSVQRNKLFIDLREVRLPWPSLAIILRGKMMAIMTLARNHGTHLVFWDLDADVEELTVCLYISVVAAGHLVLAGEGCVRQIVGAQVGRPHLGPDCAGTP